MNRKFKLKRNKLFIFLVTIFAITFLAMDVSAASLMDSIGCCRVNGGYDCGIDSFIRIALWGAWFILSISGSLSLLFFVYGGFVFLTSAGSSERVTKGKQIIINSLIGLAIIFASYMIINFILISVDYNSNNAIGQPWFQAPPSSSSCNSTFMGAPI